MRTLTVPQLRTLTDLIMTDDAGDAPCSRYGTPARRWAPFAAAATYVRSQAMAARKLILAELAERERDYDPRTLHVTREQITSHGTVIYSEV